MAPFPLLKKDTSKSRRWNCFNNFSKYHYLQVLVALGAGLSSLAPGMSMGFSAVAIPQLRPDNRQTAELPLTDKVPVNGSAAVERLTLSHDDAAWFISVTMATTPFGCLLSGYLTDKWGRKGALISVAVPGVIGWMLLATVPTVATATTMVLFQMLLGRILGGIATGMASAPACILSGETSAPCLRGAVLCVNSLGIAGGILLVYFLGEVMPGWRTVAAFGGVLTGLVALVTLALPESPVWLRSKGRFGDADWVCSQLGLRTVDSGSNRRNKENAELKDSKNAVKKGTDERFHGVLEAFRLLRDPRSLGPLLRLGGLFAFQQAAGVFVVAFNAVEVAAWSGIRGAVIDGNMTAVLIGTSTFIVVTIVCIFIDRWGRRPALILSGIGMAVSMAILAVYVHLAVPNPNPDVYEHFRPFLTSNFTKLSAHSNNHHRTPASSGALIDKDSPWHTFIPLVALLSWSIFAAIGFVPIPWALPAEMLPVETRGIGSGILSAMAYTFGFAALRIFSAALLSITLSACLFVMAVFAAAGAAFVAVFLQETRGVAIDGLEEKGSKWTEVLSPLSKSACAAEEDTSVYVA